VPGAGIPIIGYGAGGHAKSLLEALRSSERFHVVALADDDPRLEGATILGVPVVVGDALQDLRNQGIEHAFVGIGGVTSPDARRRAFSRLVAAGFVMPQVVHAAAAVSPWAELGRGAQVLALSVVNAAAAVGDGAIVNTGAVVEHDCVVGESAHLGPRAVLGGHATVGAGAHVGMGAVVVEGRRVGEGAFVAAGAVVVADVPDSARVAGVPARVMAR
jgi:sugar O-acyltransferase (sialic acid O-acetyltransferase NeuD family)